MPPASGDHIDIAMYHIADRAVIDALLAANARGARVRLILEPDKDSEGIGQHSQRPGRKRAHHRERRMPFACAGIARTASSSTPSS